MSDIYKRMMGSFIDEPKTKKTLVTEDKMAIGKGKFANLYKVKEDMKEGKFDPKNPQVHIIGLGVYNLQTMEKVIKRDLISRANDLGYERGDFPVSEQIANKIMSLPMHPYLEKIDQDFILETLNGIR